MLNFLPVIVFLSVGFAIHEPVSLQASATAIILALLLLIIDKRSKYRFGVEHLLLLVLLLVYTMSSICNSSVFILEFQGNYGRNFGLSTILALSVIFFIASQLGKTNRGENAIAVYTLFTLVILYGLLQVLELDPIPWSNPSGAVQLTLGNPNFAGALIGMMTVIPFSGIFASRTRFLRTANTLILLLTVYLAFNTQSLQAIFTSFVAIAVFSIVRLNFSGQVKYKNLRRGFLVLLTGILLFTVGIMFKFSSLSKLGNYFYYEGSIGQRLDYWRTGIQMFFDHPILGVGPDQFYRYAGIYRTSEQVIRDTNFVIPDRAHNVFIDHFANGGLVAGTVWILFVFFISKKLLIGSKNLDNLRERQSFAFWGAIWAGYVFQALISPDHILLSILGFLSAGKIVGVFNKINSFVGKFEFTLSSRIFNVYGRAVVALVLIFSLTVWGSAFRSDYHYKKVFNGTLSESEVRDKVSIWPSPKPLEEVVILVAQQATTKCDFTDELSEKLLEIDDRNSQAYFLKAICANYQGNFEEALEYTKKSLEYDPMNQVFLAAQVKLAIASGDKSSAEEFLAIFREKFPANEEIPVLEVSVKDIEMLDPL